MRTLVPITMTVLGFQTTVAFAGAAYPRPYDVIFSDIPQFALTYHLSGKTYYEYIGNDISIKPVPGLIPPLCSSSDIRSFLYIRNMCRITMSASDDQLKNPSPERCYNSDMCVKIKINPDIRSDSEIFDIIINSIKYPCSYISQVKDIDKILFQSTVNTLYSSPKEQWEKIKCSTKPLYGKNIVIRPDYIMFNLEK